MAKKPISRRIVDKREYACFKKAKRCPTGMRKTNSVAIADSLDCRGLNRACYLKKIRKVRRAE